MLKYLSIIKDGTNWPVISDSTPEVLCVPPVINGKFSQMSIQSHNILIEVTTSVSPSFCKEVLDSVLLGTARIVHATEDEPLVVAQVEVARLAIPLFSAV